VLLALLQFGVWPADSLLAEGKLPAAESAYYAEARSQPKNPTVRAALGKFLAARGGTKAGAVLIDEARFFGGDSATLARALVPLFVRMGDYQQLATLRPDVLTSAERQRARWLVANPPQARLQGNSVVLTYQALGDGRGLGTIPLRIGKAGTQGSEVIAIIDPRVSGLVLPGWVRRDLRTFGNNGPQTLAVAEQLRVGGATFTNVPAIIGGDDERPRIGFDVLAPFYPRFDSRNGMLALQRVDRRATVPAGVRVPALYDSDGMRLLINGKWYPSTAEAPSMLLATRRWMWDWKLGDVILLP
jgi:hypothetical protein